MERIAVVSSFVHRFTVALLSAVVAIHVAEVLRNQWVVKNGVFWRMWPPIGGGKEPSESASRTEPGGAAVGVAPPR
jgi:hypothetical protein